ncbi:MAG TPA: CHRD domain-containing protein [Longimicrobiales bacterium]|nr:CHRD domain-containing protein [Longimicrobiales bacterium]
MQKRATCLILVSALAWAACDSDDEVAPQVRSFSAALAAGAEPHEQFEVTLSEGHEPHTRFTAALSGSNEVPAVTTDAVGNATFTVVGSTLSYRIDVADIASVFGAHIHKGAPGVNGGVMVGLFAGPDTTLGAMGTLAEGTVEVADSVVELMRTGQAYVNVHTRAHPGGEIRGPVSLVSTGATGSATFTLVGADLRVRLDVADIDSATAAHIHAGGAGVAGPVLVPLFGGPTKGLGFTGTLADTTIQIADSVAARMRAGTAYVNVHTTANPAGHIRGQVTPVTTSASGLAAFTLRGNDLQFTLDVSGADSATAAHIHLGDAGVAGPILVPLFSGPPTGLGFSGTLASGTVAVADSVVSHMAAGRTYVNVHTRAIPAGAIRGQVQEQ